MVSKKTMNTLLAGAVAVTALGTMGATGTAHAASKEKCYGVVKAGMNDCGNAAKTHSCAGHAKVDGDGGEWLSLPKGTCEKLVGGSLTPIETSAVTETTTTVITETVESVKTKATEEAQKKATDAATSKIKGLMGN